ncbi:MAG: hypothetical protein ABR899_00435 [Candidatus Krumholzibacteriaceae bacterium]|jgi:hypothetical protein
MPQYAGKPFTKLSVIAVMRNKDDSRAFELAAVSKLKAACVDAVPGFSFLPGDSLCSQGRMEQCVKGTSADGVLMFKLIAIDKTRSYVPPTDFLVAGGSFPGWWDDRFWGYYAPYPYHYWGYWYPAYQVVRTPAYWETSTNYQVETVLYRTADNKLIWMSMSGTYDPKSGFDLGKSLSEAVIGKLQRVALIPGVAPR